jgi:hypothetical protein
VLVNPMIDIIATGGIHFLSSLGPESSEVGNSVVRYGPPPVVSPLILKRRS